jgi:type III secretory pathway component EscR
MAEFSSYSLILISILLALLPMVLGVATSYIKISVVLGMIKSALGTQHVPNSLVVMSLSTVLSVYVMSPIFREVQQKLPNLEMKKLLDQPDGIAKLTPAFEPWCLFMQKHAHRQELLLFHDLHKQRLLNTAKETENLSKPMNEQSADSKTCMSNIYEIMPAFLISELKEGFIMAFSLLLPFLVVDLIVANILVGLGMVMVSPVMIALPLKLLLFVIADGWVLIVKGLVLSYV